MELIDLKQEIEDNLLSNSNKKKFKNYFFREGILKERFPHIYSALLEHDPIHETLIEKVVTVYKNDGKIIVCPVCSRPTNYSAAYGNFAKYCSSKCESLSEEKRETARKNINPQILKEKFKEKYGVDNSMQLESVKEKVKKTNLERYGVENTFQTQHAKDRTREYNRELSIKYREEKGLNKENLHDLYNIQKKTADQIGKILGVHPNIVGAELEKCGIIKRYNWSVSSYERELAEFLIELDITDFHTSDRKTIAPKELDIFLPSASLGIEINGIYWHSEQNGFYSTRHLEKLKLCEAKNITLLQFWDIEWINKTEIVKSIIRNHLGLIENRIPSRKCSIVEVSSRDYREFLEKNHIQGAKNSSVRLGLVDSSNELISVMGFHLNREGYEMTRFCNRINTSVVGSASRLFKHFISSRYYDGEEIVTFADRRIFTGKMYQNLGFEFVYESRPNYWYFKKNSYELSSRLKFQKHKLKNILSVFDETLSESRNMENNGYLRVFDCGNNVYKYKKPGFIFPAFNGSI